jgi:hypothetical protein
VGWHYRIEVTKNEQNWQCWGQFFEHTQIVYIEQVKADLFDHSFLHHVESRFKHHQGQISPTAGYSLDNFRQRAERTVQDKG